MDPVGSYDEEDPPRPKEDVLATNMVDDVLKKKGARPKQLQEQQQQSEENAAEKEGQEPTRNQLSPKIEDPPGFKEHRRDSSGFLNK